MSAPVRRTPAATADPTLQAPAQRRALASGLLIALAALAVYANTLSNGFALDDVALIVENTRVHELGEPGSILLTPYWPEFGARTGLYRPLPVLGWAVQWAAGSGQPWLFHTVSWLLFATVSVLVFALLRHFFGRGPALAGGLLFAVHPVHTEVVANVVGQSELIAACAVLAACVLHLRWTVGGHVQNPWRHVLVLTALFAVALLAKESAIVLPALLVSLDAARGALGGARSPAAADTIEADPQPTAAPLRYARAAAPLIIGLGVVVAGWLGLRLHVLGSITGTEAAPTLPLLENTGARLLVALAAWPQYVRLMLFPLDLSADYAPGVFQPPAGITAAVVLGGTLLITIIGLALMVQRRPNAGLPAAWFLIAILPVSNLLFPIGVLLAERLLFLPSVALSIAAAHAAAGASHALEGRGMRLVTAAAGLLLIAGVLRTVTRNPDWQDTDAFWNALVRDHPESYKAQRAVAQVMEQRGDLAGARRYTELAWSTWPHDAELATELAVMRMRDGEFDDVIPVLEGARSSSTMSRRTRIVLARAYLANARWADALGLLVAADTDAEVVALRAQAQEGLGRHVEAAASWQLVTSLPDGQAWTWWTLLARSLARTGDRDGAHTALDRAHAIAPAAGRPLIGEVRAAVENGCYAVDTSSGAVCRDPIAGWALVTRNGALESMGARRSHDGTGDRMAPAPARHEGSS